MTTTLKQQLNQFGVRVSTEFSLGDLQPSPRIGIQISPELAHGSFGTTAPNTIKASLAALAEAEAAADESCDVFATLASADATAEEIDDVIDMLAQQAGEMVAAIEASDLAERLCGLF